MADAHEPVVRIGENSPEQVAYRLFQHVAFVERRKYASNTAGTSDADRKYILDTYAECLNAVRHSNVRVEPG